MRSKPYVGITGVTTRSQSEAISKYVEALGWPQATQVMVGVLASYKGLCRQPVNRNQYPEVEQIGSVLINDRGLLNLVHYNSRADGLAAQLIELLSDAGWADGVQLNIPWPPPEVLRRFRSRTYMTVVQQISTRAYRMAGGTPERLVRSLSAYEGLIEYVLIDPSGGTGHAFDAEFAKSALTALVDSQLEFKWGIAGGLGTDNLERLRPLLDLYPGLSWDAQARLRTADDRLDPGKWEPYLAASWSLITEYR